MPTKHKRRPPGRIIPAGVSFEDAIRRALNTPLPASERRKPAKRRTKSAAK